MQFNKRILISCVVLISFIILLILFLYNAGDTSASQDQMMKHSPATRIEYQINGSITSCIEWGPNSVLSDVFSEKQIVSQNLRKTSMDIDTSQWIIRVTFHIDEVSVNVPEIVCLVGDGWVSIDGVVYDFPSDAESQQWITWLTDYFYSELALNGEEIRQNNS